MPDPNGTAKVPYTDIAPMKDELLRRMNHREWLDQFASMLAMQTTERGRPMTPFLAGAISRLKFASAYIELLYADIGKLKREIADLKHEDTEGR